MVAVNANDGVLVGDAALDPARPEALMYESRNGKLHPANPQGMYVDWSP